MSKNSLPQEQDNKSRLDCSPIKLSPFMNQKRILKLG